MSISEEKPKKTGRPASGKSRSVIEKESAKKYREKLIAEGKTPLKAFIDVETKEHLQTLKGKMNLNTVGDVIDVLAVQEVKRRK